MATRFYVQDPWNGTTVVFVTVAEVPAPAAVYCRERTTYTRHVAIASPTTTYTR